LGKLNYTKRMSDEAARKGNQKLVKSINRSIVLNIVREHGPVSRADVSRLSQFYPATVSSIVNDLISEGFVREAGLGDSTGGRQPVMLQLDRRAGISCGVSIGVDRLRACVSDLDAQVLTSEEASLDWGQGPRRCMPAVPNRSPINRASHLTEWSCAGSRTTQHIRKFAHSQDIMRRGSRSATPSFSRRKSGCQVVFFKRFAKLRFFNSAINWTFVC